METDGAESAVKCQVSIVNCEDDTPSVDADVRWVVR